MLTERRPDKNQERMESKEAELITSAGTRIRDEAAPPKAPVVWMKYSNLLKQQREALYSRLNVKILSIAQKERKKKVGSMKN